MTFSHIFTCLHLLTVLISIYYDFPFSYEKCYMEDVKLKASERVKDDGVKEPSKDEIIPKPEAKESNQYSKTSTSYTAEQDLDVFLLGGDSDEDPGTTTNFH